MDARVRAEQVFEQLGTEDKWCRGALHLGLERVPALHEALLRFVGGIFGLDLPIV